MVTPTIQKMIDTGNIEGAISSLEGSKTKNNNRISKDKEMEELEVIKSKINIFTISINFVKKSNIN